MAYASFADLPLEICDEIVDLCSALGGKSLLWKCVRVHTAFMPRIYGLFFRHISFSSTLPFADQYRESRISSFIDILHKRPFIAHLIKSFGLQLHERNDWLIDNEGSRFPELMRLLKGLDAQPSQLCISKLPGVDIAHLASQDRLREELISPFFSDIVRSLKLIGVDVSHNTLAAFTRLEEVIFDRTSVSWVSSYDSRESSPGQYHSVPAIRSLQVCRCLKGEGVTAFFNQWCGLPFQFSELRELQCPIERASEAILLMHLQKSINSTTFGSKLQQIHVQIDFNLPYNRNTLDHLNFAHSPRLKVLRITLKTPVEAPTGQPPDWQAYVQSMTSLLRPSGLPQSLQRVTIDFIFISALQCKDTIRGTRWNNLLKNSSQGSTKIDLRINFIICGHVNPQIMNMHSPFNYSSNTVAAAIERLRFDGWYFFTYEQFEGESKPLRLVKNFIRYSAHSTWAQPASQDDILFIYHQY